MRGLPVTIGARNASNVASLSILNLGAVGESINDQEGDAVSQFKERKVVNYSKR